MQYSNMSVSMSNFSVTQKLFFSRSIVYVSANQLFAMTFQIQRHFHFYTGMSSTTFSEEEPFCYYMKKLLCLSPCKNIWSYKDDTNSYPSRF